MIKLDRRFAAESAFNVGVNLGGKFAKFRGVSYKLQFKFGGVLLMAYYSLAKPTFNL
jgi:hypothetical protein